MSLLHVTNGSVFADRLEALNLPGQRLSWIDILHEGPVPSVSLDSLITLRAYFISQQQWGSFDEVSHSLRSRAKLLMKQFRRGDEIVLWFEDDLFDQLQLMQILFEFWQSRKPYTNVRLIQTDSNLMNYRDEDLLAVYETRKPITEAVMDDAITGWLAFVAAIPTELNALRHKLFAELPLVKEALWRVMREYPSHYNGLSQTEQSILDGISEGTTGTRDLFKKVKSEEKRPYLGDTSFVLNLRRLMRQEYGLVQFAKPSVAAGPEALWGQELELTTRGELLQDGDLHLLEYCTVDRWVGGVQIQRPGRAWVWNEIEQQITEFMI